MLIKKSRLHSWSSRIPPERAEMGEVETDGVEVEEVVADLVVEEVVGMEEEVVVDVVGGRVSRFTTLLYFPRYQYSYNHQRLDKSFCRLIIF